MSQYFFGATHGMCGLWKPTARKNGFSLISFNTLIAFSAIWPSRSLLSATSGDSYGNMLARGSKGSALALRLPDFVRSGLATALPFASTADCLALVTCLPFFGDCQARALQEM